VTVGIFALIERTCFSLFANEAVN